MKSRFISAAVAGALVLMLSQIAAASPGLVCDPSTCKTAVSVTVTEGTTIMAPAAVDMTSAFPGQTATSAAQTVSWWSNEFPKSLTVSLDSALANSTDNTTIAKTDVQVSSVDYATWVNLGVARPVAKVIDVNDAVHGHGTLESASSSQFTLRVNVPSATEGSYGAFMTRSVQ